MNNIVGLTETQALANFKKFGPNEITSDRLGNWLRNAKKILLDPMGLMLLVLGFTYLLLGQTSDAIVLLLAYIPIVAVDVLLELRSQTALRALKKTMQTHCHVIRAGRTVRLAVRNVVPEDMVVLEEGQSIPADGKLVQISNLTIDESSLTGESVPIAKSAGDEVLSGTSVLTGTGIFKVEKTGMASQIGTIGKILQEFNEVPSPLLRTIQSLVKTFFVIALGLAAVVFVWSIFRGEAWSEALIPSLTLAMAAIPEEFPLVFTIYLSLATYRLSKQGIMVKSITAVEGLGRVDVICTDKTGTLTEGHFQLERVLKPAGSGELEEMELTALALACEIKAVDAMEAAIFAWIGKKKGEGFIQELHDQWNLIHDYPFDPAQKYMCHVWRNVQTGQEIVAMKGAIEGVLAHCISGPRAAVEESAKRESENGMRLLGLAFRTGKFSGQREQDEANLQFVSILSFSDPVRSDVPEAIKQCKARGINVKMLTGDHLLTAHSIADRIGLPHSHDQLYDGPGLERMEVSAREKAFRAGNIFARLKPEQKLELVKSLKAKGSVVAMTGDGINDGPALKLADVGISMGERATDVARSAAQMVLLKSHFSGIIHAIIEGERVFESLRESFGYLIAFHIPIVSLAVIQAFFLEHPIFFPIHIILLELVIHPVSAFAFDRPLSEKPLSRSRSLMSSKQMAWSAARGIILTALALAAFVFVKGSVEERRSFALIVLILGNIGLVYGEKVQLRISVPNLLVAVILTLLSSVLLYVPAAANFFHVTQLPFTQFLIIWVLGVALSVVTPLWVPRNSESNEDARHRL